MRIFRKKGEPDPPPEPPPFELSKEDREIVHSVTGRDPSPADDELPEQENRKRRTPFNDLELQYMITDPAWGKEPEIELYHAVTKVSSEAYYMCLSCKKPFGAGITCQSCGGSYKKLVIDKTPLWGLLTYYTRDLRLGNLSTNDYVFTCHWLSLAGDLLRCGHILSFLSALSRVIDVIELSQSKGSSTRKLMATVRTEIAKSDLYPNNKKLLGGVKE